VRRDRLDRLLVLGPRHWEQVLEEYVAHYHTGRPHRVLQLQAPVAHRQPTWPTRPVEAVVRRDRLGVLIHEYEPLAG
jgi:hypothetical protein